jgi:hypothetical protein
VSEASLRPDPAGRAGPLGAMAPRRVRTQHIASFFIHQLESTLLDPPPSTRPESTPYDCPSAHHGGGVRVPTAASASPASWSGVLRAEFRVASVSLLG